MHAARFDSESMPVEGGRSVCKNSKKTATVTLCVPCLHRFCFQQCAKSSSWGLWHGNMELFRNAL